MHIAIRVGADTAIERTAEHTRVAVTVRVPPNAAVVLFNGHEVQLLNALLCQTVDDVTLIRLTVDTLGAQRIDDLDARNNNVGGVGLFKAVHPFRVIGLHGLVLHSGQSILVFFGHGIYSFHIWTSDEEVIECFNKVAC